MLHWLTILFWNNEVLLPFPERENPIDKIVITVTQPSGISSYTEYVTCLNTPL